MKITELIGYCGIITLNGAAIIPIILITQNIHMNTGVIMSALLMFGLIFILIRSVANKDLLNTINCSIGASLNAVLLILLN